MTTDTDAAQTITTTNTQPQNNRRPNNRRGNNASNMGSKMKNFVGETQEIDGVLGLKTKKIEKGIRFDIF